MNAIYLDHNATTPVHPDVLEAMLPLLKEDFGNPSSTHSRGRSARVKMDEAREQVAALIHADAREIVFTSGGTESDNLAILGAARALRDKGRHIVTARVEHPAVLNACLELQKEGFVIDYAPVDEFGRVRLDGLEALISDETVLITIQSANSEVGTLQPIAAIGEIARDREILFHTDAVQSAGKVPLDVKEVPVDLLSLSSHKLYGPKGVGALYVRRGLPQLVPLIVGGGQEKKRRGGTENLPGIAGFGRAAELAAGDLEQEAERLRQLKRRLRDGVSSLQGVRFFGHPDESLPNTLNLGFEGVDGQTLMIRLDLDQIYVSTGTACSSGSVLPSDVLTAMGMPEEQMRQSIRISFGRSNGTEDVERVAEALVRIVTDIREKQRMAS
ncbi:putative cysteine desulfurase [Nitrospina gracilis 3/211]|uniref:cysteine desulfurase n=2 Tax=Nitrospina TaxID=35800 RepID=M1Z0W9_NITG3|nr:cysteine desulfurase family protein [Nitrospina sp. Nb-3]MCF8724231.1 cysteine desulfurase [Nitrospina sp. Nb-3]CCQ91376.1 putative cysteine desulfurase [Nitrospina gracilis 3/211]